MRMKWSPCPCCHSELTLEVHQAWYNLTLPSSCPHKDKCERRTLKDAGIEKVIADELH
jgi:hypothetical protein